MIFAHMGDQGKITFLKIYYNLELLQRVLTQYDDATLKDSRKVVPHIQHANMCSFEVWSELDATINKNCWRMVQILLDHTTITCDIFLSWKRIPCQ